MKMKPSYQYSSIYRVSQKVHNFAQVLLNIETTYMNKLCLAWEKSFNLDFSTLFLKIEQKLTVLWELEDQNAPNLETRGPIQF